ncbi:hypothetical protein UPYG_G00273840 [Umbra pygmaea]|uniref:AIG1-type G domain-containing protein n=1 Tax=Umbra pygmaea TaxID=75934 RepID=A0ABD0W6L3_UMBPY
MTQGSGGAHRILLLLPLFLQVLNHQCQGSEERAAMRIVLLGKTGAGKSTTGNIILRREAFKSDFSPVSVTSQCEKQSGVVAGRKIDVIDTPGLCDTSATVEEVQSEIENAVLMSVPGPHVFLLVIRLDRFTEEERKTVKSIQENFGAEASNYTIVVFTHRNQLKTKRLKDFIKESESLQKLLDTCGKRYYSIDISDNYSPVGELLEMIEKMVKSNGGQHYTNQMYQDAQRKIKDEEEKKRMEVDRKEKEEKDKLIEELLSKEIRREEQDKLRMERKKIKKVRDGINALGAALTTGAAVVLGPVAVIGGAVMTKVVADYVAPDDTD